METKKKGTREKIIEMWINFICELGALNTEGFAFLGSRIHAHNCASTQSEPIITPFIPILNKMPRTVLNPSTM